MTPNSIRIAIGVLDCERRRLARWWALYKQGNTQFKRLAMRYEEIDRAITELKELLTSANSGV